MIDEVLNATQMLASLSTGMQRKRQKHELGGVEVGDCRHGRCRRTSHEVENRKKKLGQEKAARVDIIRG